MRTGTAGRKVAEAPPPDGALLRLVVGEGHWAEDLPPVPRGHEVTVSFSSAAASDEHAEALELLGYRAVGVGSVERGAAAPAGSAPVSVDVADFLVPQRLLEEHPTYWRSLADQADRAFSLALGPVLALLGDVLRVHARRPA